MGQVHTSLSRNKKLKVAHDDLEMDSVDIETTSGVMQWCADVMRYTENAVDGTSDDTHAYRLLQWLQMAPDIFACADKIIQGHLTKISQVQYGATKHNQAQSLVATPKHSEDYIDNMSAVVVYGEGDTLASMPKEASSTDTNKRNVAGTTQGDDDLGMADYVCHGSQDDLGNAPITEAMTAARSSMDPTNNRGGMPYSDDDDDMGMTQSDMDKNGLLNHEVQPMPIVFYETHSVQLAATSKAVRESLETAKASLLVAHALLGSDSATVKIICTSATIVCTLLALDAPPRSALSVKTRELHELCAAYKSKYLLKVLQPMVRVDRLLTRQHVSYGNVLPAQAALYYQPSRPRCLM